MSDFPVGYGKPPKDRQFKKGQSGNPKGRPRGSQNFATILKKVSMEKIAVKKNGCTKKMTCQEALTRQVYSKALGGDLRASTQIVKWDQMFEATPEAAGSQRHLEERDKAALGNILKRMQRLASAGEVAE
jgi:hypothetical protein